MTTAKRADPAAAEKAPIKRMMPSAPETGSAHPSEKTGQSLLSVPWIEIAIDPSAARESIPCWQMSMNNCLRSKKRLSDQGLPVKGDLLRAGRPVGRA